MFSYILVSVRRLHLVALICAMVCVACTTPATPPSAPFNDSLSALPKYAGAPAELKIGIVVFLSGSAAEPFGIPARNTAQVIIDALNRGSGPAPYDTPGIAGVPVRAIYVDEAGGAEKQVAELRRLYQEENVHLVIGYISSADCLAGAPVAEELSHLLVVFDCGTSRLFEENSFHYVFRTNAHQAIDSLGGARYLLYVYPETVIVAGINQNYAWGQDSWTHFRDALHQLKPEIAIVGAQFPKLNAGDYSAEIAALMQVKPQIVHTSFWGADLGQLVDQARGAGFFRNSRLLMSVGEYALPDLGARVQPGTIIGAHGPHGVLAPPGELNDWLVEIYRRQYDQRPTYPSYHMVQALLGVKLAYERAALQAGIWPDLEQVIRAFEHLEYPTPSGPIRLAIGNGHQAIEPAVYGLADDYDFRTGEIRINNVVVYPAECVNPPDGKPTEQWIREGFPGNNCP